MSFFKKLFGGVAGAVASAKTEATEAISKLQRMDDVEAMLAIIALVAGADGEVEKEERDMAVDFVRSGDVFKNFDRSKLATTLEDNFRKCTNEIMRDDLYDKIRGIADEPETARKVVNAGIAIASADGEFEPQEREVLIEVCKVLSLDHTSFRKLATVPV